MSETTTTQKQSSKAKSELAEDLNMSLAALKARSICWVPVPLDPQTKQLLTDVASVRNRKVHAILSSLCLEAIEKSRKTYEKEAEAIVSALAEEMTEVELKKEAMSLQRQLERLNSALAKKTAPVK